jgi:cell division protein FtsQ
LPSARVALIGAAVVALAGGAVAFALETSVFAVRKIDVVGGAPAVKSEIEAALAPELGLSLFRVDAGQIDRLVAPLTDVVGVSMSRDFPSTLKIRVKAERPVLLLRRQKDTWLVSARGRVIRELHSSLRSSLPRMWVPKTTNVSVGETLPPLDGRVAAAALAPISHSTFGSPVRFVISSSSELTFKLASGLGIRLGGLGDLGLKLAIAKRILERVGTSADAPGYLDVSVPARPVFAT